MALHIIAEAVLRVEHKLDAILKFLKVETAPMHFVGSSCPACRQPIDYVVDIQHQVVSRRCDCKTGKIPPTTPLFPVPGAQSGQPNARSGSSAPQDGDQRKAR